MGGELGGCSCPLCRLARCANSTGRRPMATCKPGMRLIGARTSSLPACGTGATGREPRACVACCVSVSLACSRGAQPISQSLQRCSDMLLQAQAPLAVPARSACGARSASTNAAQRASQLPGLTQPCRERRRRCRQPAAAAAAGSAQQQQQPGSREAAITKDYLQWANQSGASTSRHSARTWSAWCPCWPSFCPNPLPGPSLAPPALRHPVSQADASLLWGAPRRSSAGRHRARRGARDAGPPRPPTVGSAALAMEALCRWLLINCSARAAGQLAKRV